MAQKSGKKKKPVSANRRKAKPIKKTGVKKKEIKGKGKKPAIVKKVTFKAKKLKKIKEVKAVKEAKKTKKPVIIPREFRLNIRCRRCFFVDGYVFGERTCHNCREEIYEIDKI